MSAWEYLIEIVGEIERSGYKHMRTERVVHAFAPTSKEPIILHEDDLRRLPTSDGQQYLLSNLGSMDPAKVCIVACMVDGNIRGCTIPRKARD